MNRIKIIITFIFAISIFTIFCLTSYSNDEYVELEDLDIVSNVYLTLGNSYNIVKNTVPSNATTTGKFSYSSSDDTIATVNATEGIVTACSPGKALINVVYYDSENNIRISKDITFHIVFKTGAGSLIYDPAKWNENDDHDVKDWNCYTYAFNLYKPEDTPLGSDLTEYDFSPGGIYQIFNGGYTLDGYTKRSSYAYYVTNDILIFYPDLEREEALIEVGLNDEVEGERYKVVLFVDDNNASYGPSFHWYRQNSDGTWSQKDGGKPVTNLDANNEIIYNPVTCAKIDGYQDYEYVGCYAVLPWCED